MYYFGWMFLGFFELCLVSRLQICLDSFLLKWTSNKNEYLLKTICYVYLLILVVSLISFCLWEAYFLDHGPSVHHKCDFFNYSFFVWNCYPFTDWVFQFIWLEIKKLNTWTLGEKRGSRLSVYCCFMEHETGDSEKVKILLLGVWGKQTYSILENVVPPRAKRALDRVHFHGKVDFPSCITQSKLLLKGLNLIWFWSVYVIPTTVHWEVIVCALCQWYGSTLSNMIFEIPCWNYCY